MLVLTRRPSESIVISGGTAHEARVTVNEIREGKVRLGIEAAPHVNIYRHEVQDRVDQEGIDRELPEPTQDEIGAAVAVLRRAGYVIPED